ncbi:MAG TPA: hypothetical protein VG738_12505 [Chitinophagaceae bacterium]|nr:hypothetical protein [Chitinophagaceae bacterium]
MKDIYKRVVKEGKINSKYRLLTESSLFDPAKNIIQNISSLMPDKDGNFIQQFQSDGFDARLWEIYVYIFLKENDFTFLDDVDRPDFHVKKNGLDLFIEASLSSEKEEDLYSKNFIEEAIARHDLDVQQRLIDYYIMRMGSVLFSKLQKRYWELEWVKDKPLVIAITPAHNFIANFLPDAKIIEYLYGIRKIVRITENGLEHVEDMIISEHKFNEKVIPSGFFLQPSSENISAVMFTNNSDLHKFNRMGFQYGLTNQQLLIFRSGFRYNPKPNGMAREFTYMVKNGERSETWSESVSIFHNPNALIKLDNSIFLNTRQVRLEEGNTFGGNITDDFVFNSKTVVASIE